MMNVLKHYQNQLSESAIGASISKFKCFRDTGYETFTKPLNSGLQPVQTCGVLCSGTKDIDRIIIRACHYYSGLHKFYTVTTTIQ